MPSDNINATAVATQLPRAPTRTHHQASGPALATQAESIPCPRCDSNNTKFCYYNNYNLSQPRHFCKSCRRYWTHGGTLRNIPVGGGTRKSSSYISANSSSPSSFSNKRPRCSPATVSHCSSSPALSFGHDGVSSNGAQTAGSVGVKGMTAPSHGVGSGVGSGLGLGVSSLLSAPGSNTFLALGGYGPGYVPALDGVGFGFSRGVWPFPDASLVEASSYGNFRGPVIGLTGVDAWHVGGGVGCAARDVEGGGLIDGEVFAWPELAISMPGQGLK